MRSFAEAQDDSTVLFAMFPTLNHGQLNSRKPSWRSLIVILSLGEGSNRVLINYSLNYCLSKVF